MNAIKNTGFLNLFAITVASGFNPSVGYVYNPGAATITVQDNSAYPAGYGLKIAHVYVTDSEGGQMYMPVTVTGAPGAQTFDVSGLNAIEGFNITCTVIGNNGAVNDLRAELSAYGVGSTSPVSGSLSYINKQTA